MVSTRIHFKIGQVILDLFYQLQTVFDLFLLGLLHTLLYQFFRIKMDNLQYSMEIAHPRPWKAISIGETIMVAAFCASC